LAGDFDLAGRVALVTGGNGGIGLGMAKALARASCIVSIWGRNEDMFGREIRSRD
jgi:NAD(P)-dependent dehydrogenase (short-subunit alcohol dehydrogenase family)